MRASVAGLAAAAAVLGLAGEASAASKPSLSIARLGELPSAVEAGATFSIAGRVANAGGRDAPAIVRFALRRGPDAGPLGTRLSTRRLDVPAGEKVRFVHALEVPADTAPGEYGLSACVPQAGKRRPAALRAGADGRLDR